MGHGAHNMEDPADREPFTSIPRVEWLIGGTLREGPGYRVLRPDGVDDHLLVHTTGGRGRFGHRGADVLAGPGTVTLLRPGTPHDYGVETELQRWEIEYCHFRPRAEWQVLLDWPEPSVGIGQLVVEGESRRRMSEALTTAARFAASGRPRAEMFGMNMLEQALLWCDASNPRTSRLDVRVVAVLEYLDRHLGRPLSVRDLAAVATLSPSRFAHLFTEAMGAPPLAYVEGRRMMLARQLLDQTSRPVVDVAREVGYADPLYFSTRFRKAFGVSPSAYRSHGLPAPGATGT